MSLPEGWKTTTIGEILTEEQFERVSDILKGCYNHVDAEQRLLPYFESIREQLESKGIIPEYLAYSLPYWITHPHPPKP